MSAIPEEARKSEGMKRWEGRVALVTGASKGIGASICRELVREGMIVVGCARNIAEIGKMAQEEENLKSPGRLHAIECDLSDELKIKKMHKEIESRFKRLDVCINNAMSCINSSLLNGELVQWKSMLEVNVMGLCINTREAIKFMIENKEVKEAQIIHMGSIDGHRIPPLRKLGDNPPPWFHVYFGTKFMTRALAEGLRQELKEKMQELEEKEKEKKTNIRVSTISPGPVQTESYAGSTTEETAKHFFDQFKCLEPKDVAEAVKYILSTPEHVNVNDVVLAPVEYNM